MNKTFKRILGLAVAMMMIIGVMSVTAFAEEVVDVAQIGENKFESLQGAIAAAKDGGTITQCIVNSVWERQEQKDMKIIADDPASYGTRQVLFDRDTHPLIGEYRPGIQQYHRFDGAGYATLDVTGDSVTIRYYGGDSDQPAATFII